MIYPETHAAGIGARKGAIDMLDVATRKGYNIDCCSYGRVNMGYMECLKEAAITGKKPEVLVNSPAADVPLPDLVITCNNICNTLLKWYENLAAELDIPCIVIDVPFNHTMPIPEYAKAYIADQFRNAISQLEVICGRPFDWKKFKEVKDQTQRSVYHWNRIADMAQYKPSPLNGFDLFNYMALIVACRSLDYAEITFKAFADELEANLKAGVYAFKGAEKTRFQWEGIAVWPHLGHTFKTTKNLGAIMTGTAYPDLWNLEYDANDESLHSMAEAYTRIYINTCLSNKVDVLLKIMVFMVPPVFLIMIGKAYLNNGAFLIEDFLEATVFSLTLAIGLAAGGYSYNESKPITLSNNTFTNITLNGEKFGRAKLYTVMVKYITPVLLFFLLLQSLGLFM